MSLVKVGDGKTVRKLWIFYDLRGVLDSFRTLIEISDALNVIQRNAHQEKGLPTIKKTMIMAALELQNNISPRKRAPANQSMFQSNRNHR